MDFDTLEKLYGTEKQCREYISKIRWRNGYCCPKCQSSSAWKTSELKYKCQKCGRKVSVTAGTIFQDSHVPLPVWFKAIWYISSQPDITAADLQKHLCLGSNRTALLMLHKIKKARSCYTLDSLDKLQGTVVFISRDVKINEKNEFLVIAVEIADRKSGRIRIKKIRREWLVADIPEFIDECIELNSTLLHHENALRHMELHDEYTQLIKSNTYISKNTDKIVHCLHNWMMDIPIKDNLTSLLDEFCRRVNSLKISISFYDLLETVIKFNLSDSKPFGIEI